MKKSFFTIAPAIAFLCLPLSSCSLFQNVADRLLSIDYHLVEFSPPSGLDSEERQQRAEQWRSRITAVAQQVQGSVTANQVYGDTSLWNSVLQSAMDTRVTSCEATNNDDKSLRIAHGPGVDDVLQAAIRAEPVELSHQEIPSGDRCPLVDISQSLQALSIIVRQPSANPVEQGVPVVSDSHFVTLEASVGGGPNLATVIWPWLEFRTFTVTFEPSITEGAAQFAFMVRQPTQSDYEKVIIVTRGSYIGEVKIAGQ